MMKILSATLLALTFIACASEATDELPVDGDEAAISYLNCSAKRQYTVTTQAGDIKYKTYTGKKRINAEYGAITAGVKAAREDADNQAKNDPDNKDAWFKTELYKGCTAAPN